MLCQMYIFDLWCVYLCGVGHILGVVCMCGKRLVYLCGVGMRCVYTYVRSPSHTHGLQPLSESIRIQVTPVVTLPGVRRITM